MSIFLWGWLSGVFAQCPYRADLRATGKCVGDTLRVGSSHPLARIVWQNGNQTDTVVLAGTSGYSGLTVAGGNGAGDKPNQLHQPEGIFVDKVGNVYIADFVNFRVQKWTPGATAGTTVAGGNGFGTDATRLYSGNAVYVDANEFLYVSDQANNRIQRWAPRANAGITVAGGNGPGAAANQFFGPAGVFMDGNGYLYVPDVNNNRVQRFPPGSTSTTEATTVAGSPSGVAGMGTDQLDRPQGIFVDAAGDVYVADQNNFRVQKWAAGAASGVTVAGGKGPGSGPYQLGCPSDVFVDDQGNLFVTDACNYAVFRYSPGSDSGVMVAGSNPTATGLGQLTAPGDIFVDRSGALFIGDDPNSRVLKYTPRRTIDTVRIPRTPGVYTALVTDSSGCSFLTDAVEIDPAIPDGVSIVSSVGPVCPDSVVSFLATSSDGVATPSYQWRINGVGSGTDDPVFSYNSWRNGDLVNCLLTLTGVCASPALSNTIVLSVKPVPGVYAGNDTLIKPGTHLLLDPSVMGAAGNYQWTPSTGLDNPSVLQPLATPDATTTYRLTVTGVDGCTASGKITITVYYPLMMPGAFTPNGDGKNDFFRVPASTPQRIASFAVYNRRGDLIFSTTNSGIGWDGSFNNRPQPPGVYIWEVGYYDLLTGQRRKANGTVVLVR